MRPVSSRHPVSYTLPQNLPEGARPAGCPSQLSRPMGARLPQQAPMTNSTLPLRPRPSPPHPTPPRDDALTAAFWNFHSRPRPPNGPGERAGGAERARARESSVTPGGVERGEEESRREGGGGGRGGASNSAHAPSRAQARGTEGEGGRGGGRTRNQPMTAAPAEIWIEAEYGKGERKA